MQHMSEAPPPHNVQSRMLAALDVPLPDAIPMMRRLVAEFVERGYTPDEVEQLAVDVGFDRFLWRSIVRDHGSPPS